MTRNIGHTDQMIRLALGVALLAAAALLDPGWRWIAIPGAILVLTAAARVCPAYWLLRLSTATRRGKLVT